MTAKTVEKGLMLLEVLARSPEPRGLTDLVRELGMPKSNVFRLLDTLAENRYIRRRPEDSRYELTLKLWELGNHAVSQANLTQVARRYLDELAAGIGESAHLAVLDEGESVFIDKKDGRHPVSGFTRIGSRAPAYCCATGKVELAFQPAEVADRVALKLERYTAATITSRSALRSELAEIRENGYAVNHGEWYEDVWGVAAAIRNRTGAVCASIGVWGPMHRLSSQLNRSAQAAMAAAHAISAALGFNQAPIPTANKRRSST